MRSAINSATVAIRYQSVRNVVSEKPNNHSLVKPEIEQTTSTTNLQSNGKKNGIISFLTGCLEVVLAAQETVHEIDPR